MESTHDKIAAMLKEDGITGVSGYEQTGRAYGNEYRVTHDKGVSLVNVSNGLMRHNQA